MERLFIILLFCSLQLTLNGQTHTLNAFKGRVYEIPAKLKYRSYQAACENYPLVAEVEYEKLHFPQRDMQIGFPGIPFFECFGILFENTLTVNQSNHFRFSMSSDDGTILWLNKQEMINNDYSNGMHTAEDTFYLAKGVYDLEIWYFQAYPTKLGLVFEMDTVGLPIPPIQDTIILNSQLLFEPDRHVINNSAKRVLDSLCLQLVKFKKAKIEITGHTDNIGSHGYNLQLSRKRAGSVAEYFKKKLDAQSFIIISQGESFDRPVATNETSLGRSQNRRVEIVIEILK